MKRRIINWWNDPRAAERDALIMLMVISYAAGAGTVYLLGLIP